MTVTAWGSTSKFYTRRPVAGLCVPNGIAEGPRSWLGRTYYFGVAVLRSETLTRYFPLSSVNSEKSTFFSI